jgi:hypothetical protein
VPSIIKIAIGNYRDTLPGHFCLQSILETTVPEAELNGIAFSGKSVS